MAKRKADDPYRMPEYDPEVSEATSGVRMGRYSPEFDMYMPPDLDMQRHPDQLPQMGAPYPMYREMADGGDPYAGQEMRSYDSWGTGRDRIGSFLRNLLSGDKPLTPAKRNLIEGLVGSTGLGPTTNNRNSGMSLADVTPLGPAMAVQEALRKKDPKEAALNAVPGAAASKAMLLGPFGAMMARRLEREAGKQATVHPVIGQEVKDKTAHIHPKLRDAVRGWDVDRRDAIAQYQLSRPEDHFRDRLAHSEAGWSRGADGLPRKEFQDTGSKIIPNPEGYGYLLDHPSVDIHKIYDVPPIKFDQKMSRGEGSFEPAKRQAILGGNPTKTNLKNSVSPALHEVGTHAVQNAEGFNKGSHPLLELESSKFPLAKNGLDPLAFSLGIETPATKLAMDRYRSRSGEVEPQNVQGRYAKSYKYKKYPGDTERIPRSEQLVEDVTDEVSPEIKAQIYGYAGGGKVTDWYKSSMKQKMPSTPTGMLKSSIPGRTDKLPLKVDPGSYVLPADIPSALGQGNTMAGSDILDKMFKKGPYGMNLPKAKAGMSTKMKRKPSLTSKFADGGEAEPADIIAAGGEFVISPEDVLHIGNGDMDAGHQILDDFVKMVRKQHVKTLQSLPGPKGG